MDAIMAGPWMLSSQNGLDMVGQWMFLFQNGLGHGPEERWAGREKSKIEASEATKT